MSLLAEWNHRWFGIWKGTRPEYSKFPNITEFITGLKLDPQELEKILHYLDNGVVVATTSRRAFPCAITGKRFEGALSKRTDGVYWWYDDLSYYMKEFGISLPQNLLDNIRRNNYAIPEVSLAQIDSLERPT